MQETSVETSSAGLLESFIGFSWVDVPSERRRFTPLSICESAPKRLNLIRLVDIPRVRRAQLLTSQLTEGDCVGHLLLLPRTRVRSRRAKARSYAQRVGLAAAGYDARPGSRLVIEGRSIARGRVSRRICSDDIPERHLTTMKRPHDCLHACDDVEAQFGTFNVPMDRVLANSQDLADRPITLALSSEFKALTLALAQAPALAVRPLRLVLATCRVVEIHRYELGGEIAARFDSARVRHNRTRSPKFTCRPRQMEGDGISAGESESGGLSEDLPLLTRNLRQEIGRIPEERQE